MAKPTSNGQISAYDVIVVGGGPAGSATAFTLAKAGLRTCLVDKQCFPREKLCGGLVTTRSKKVFDKIFGHSWDASLFLCSKKVDFFAHDVPLRDPDSRLPSESHSPLYFTMRYDFDAYLLGLARASGVTMRLGIPVSSIDLDGRTITLASGESLEFSFLIGADGVNSQVAKKLFGESFSSKTVGFGLEVEVPRERLPNQDRVVEIDFAAARWGYGWVFPKQKNFTIGVGGIHKLNPDLRNQLNEYLTRKGIDASGLRVKGQFIPFGDFRARPGNANVLLCGDAAGLVDPITGEGIAYAMQSGYYAARAVVQAHVVGDTTRAYGLYLKDYREITSAIRQANMWRRLIFPKMVQKVFARAFADASTLRHGFLDILAGEKEYSDLYGIFLHQTKKAMKKLSRRFLMRLVPPFVIPKS